VIDKTNLGKKNDIFVIICKILYWDFHLQMGQLRDTKLLQKIALVIKDLREAEGFTQEDVYNDTNIHIGRIETAKANLSVSTLSSLCKYFKIRLSEFHRRVEER
jgi:ribosome-binding protein aMBF1 (putative translation factor)